MGIDTRIYLLRLVFLSQKNITCSIFGITPRDNLRQLVTPGHIKGGKTVTRRVVVTSTDKINYRKIIHDKHKQKQGL